MSLVNIQAPTTEYLFGNFEQDLKEKLLLKKVILLIDDEVFKRHEKKFTAFFKILIPSGEAFKTQSTVNQIYQELINLEADRKTLLVGIGGGVTTDIVGYVAATYMRGLPCGFLPTTLLAQVDASIGGKNGIDMGLYKNIIGMIRQPEFIFFDTQFLKTLPQQEWINGCAEIIKHACIKDKNLFELLEKKQLSDLQNDADFLNKILRINVGIKKNVIENDPFEKGERMLLNFGHTLGHAIENKYQLCHGQAVAIGMHIATQLSQQLSTLAAAEGERISALIKQYELPTTFAYDLDVVFNILKMDKKRNRESIHFILLKNIGEAHTQSISFETLYALLAKMSH